MLPGNVGTQLSLRWVLLLWAFIFDGEAQMTCVTQILNAMATPAIALLTAVIGLMQWRTNRQKLVLDLFEKRFQVFLDVRRVASEAIQLGKLKQPGCLNEVIARARFIFGDEIYNKLVEMHALATRLEMGQPQAATDITNLFDQMTPLFTPYLGMKQKLPRLL
jgi:hypothetical protein